MAVLQIISFFCTFVLALFTTRRIILTLGAIFVKSFNFPKSTPKPCVMALVPARNEEDVVGRCLDSLLRIDWPKENIHIIAIDDGSTDATRKILEDYVRSHANCELLSRSGPNAGIGKGAALNDALERYDFGEFIYIVDADAVTSPNALNVLVDALYANNAEAAQGGMVPDEDSSSITAFYTVIESLVHQGITMTGAGRIGATVSLLGSNYLLSRKAIDALGGFHPRTRLDDIDMTMAMLNTGMKIIYEPKAESSIIPSQNPKETISQHRAWSREYFRIATSRFAETAFGSGKLWLRADRLMFAFGYLDRIFVILYMALALLSSALNADFAPWWFLAFVMSVPGIQCVLALHRYQRPLSDYYRLLVMPFTYTIDLVTHGMAFYDAIRGKGREWNRTSRKVEGP